MAASEASTLYQISDSLWERIQSAFPLYKLNCRGRASRLSLRRVVTGILYVLWTGCLWNAMPRQFGSGSAIHAYFQEWVRRGLFRKLWQTALEE